VVSLRPMVISEENELNGYAGQPHQDRLSAFCPNRLHRCHVEYYLTGTSETGHGTARQLRPKPLNEAVQTRMRNQRRRDTKLELTIRSQMHSGGFRYRVDYRPEKSLRCRGDLVFTRRKVIVFIDGCFWHGCPLHATAPKNNASWWTEKLRANIDRDARNTVALQSLGWIVVRIWEHEPADIAVERLKVVLEARQ
jgi:DNA mismatch endonuclease (patch repair protein)